MKCGIIGLPNSGKSTFFNIISNSQVLSENFPFCTIEPNHGITKVPDHRLYQLKKIIDTKKIIPAELKIVDIAGLIRGSHKGEGLGNQFLSHIRETNVLLHMIRCFQDISILHVEGSVNPIRDKEIIDIELQLKDLESIEKKIEIIKKKRDKKEEYLLNVLKNILLFLKKGKNIRMFPFKEEKEINCIKNLQLLTVKPVIYICNVNDNENNNKTINDHIDHLKNIIKKENSILVTLSLTKKIIEKENNWTNLGIEKVLKETFKLLNLHTFFTVGKKEIRAWSIPMTYTAYEASSVIHTDLKKGFIRAEVIHYNDFIKYRSEENAKKAGKMLITGKNYLIQDGDIIHFRFNR
ncbi:redox-regulated ATPase YchF [Blattabacterium cuenoti]|uniref:redox-regulated ATPase YchF n=1 Tax=Blattabacterium cuenoti TaxID=1653831 RepID=UPI00163C109C|nr:redox-regulated ATPase YchF [Blattabacterium cuenoti]